MDNDPYLAIANDPPFDVELGGALITMVEPHSGHEEEYNRWYEDDHFYVGAMVGPWVFAGRRFVTTGQPALPASGSPVKDPAAVGGYISLYWHMSGHLDEVERWALGILTEQLIPRGQGPRYRSHLYTAFHMIAFSTIFDPPPMNPIHALDHPYQGLVVELMDAPTAGGRDALMDWLRDEFVPNVGKNIGAGQCLAFVPKPFRSDLASEMGWQGRDPSARICLLWFCHASPQGEWPGVFSAHGELVQESGLGELILAAPFIPTKPGTASSPSSNATHSLPQSGGAPSRPASASPR